jgi:rhodanese-related sulfurtransferase
MATTQRMTRAQQREARRAAQEAARARDERRRRVLTVSVIAAVVAVLGAVSGLALTASGSGPTTDPGGAAYSAEKESFRLPGLIDDSTVALADFAGTPVVVNFFASWCVYCNEELPGFVQVARATADRVAFIGVDTADAGDGAAMAQRFDLAGAGFALARDIGGNPPTQLWSSFGSQGLPVTAFYDDSGRLVDFSGGLLAQDALEQRLRDNFGIDVTAPDAAELGAPVIPLIPQGAYEIMRTNPNGSTFVVLDIRPADQFAAGHLPGAVNIAYGDDAFDRAIADLDRTGSYVVYDGSGTGSGAAGEAMHGAGFLHVYDVEGGYAAWAEQGLPTEQ